MNKLVIYQFDAESPRVNCEHFSKLALHHRFESDEPIRDINEFLMELLGLSDMDRVVREAFKNSDRVGSFYSDEVKDYLLSSMNKKYVWLPVYKYEHSGISFNTTGYNCPWDSGLIGLIYVDRKRIHEEFSVKRISSALKERILNTLRSEVDEFSAWANGEVYGFSIEDENGDVLDSCGGFYGENWESSMAEHIDTAMLGGLEHDALVELIKDTDIEY